MTIKFYNREKELSLLERVEKPFLAIIYGRRRIGKTSLVLKFAENKDFIYFFVNPKKSEALLIDEFTEKLRKKLDLPIYVKPRNWEEFFELLFNYRGLVIFDEFQWFLDISKEVPYIFQKYWDTTKEKPSFIITGSVIGLIKKMFTEAESPLFKRAEVVINLKELEMKDIFKILEDHGVNSLEEKFKFYLLFGGAPYYYKLLSKYKVKDVDTAIKELVLEEFAPLRNEVEEVIIESFKREYKTYLSILYAIAEGKTKLEEIASVSGVKTTSLSYYLDDLVNLLGIVEKQKLGFKKRYIYLIRDKFHNFWLRFVYKYSSIVNKDLLLELIKKNLNLFFGWSFETTIREYLIKIFPNFEKTFKYYGVIRKANEKISFDIDAIAINERSKEILFAECKWKDKVDAKKVIEKLYEKSRYVQWNNENRKEYFAIFAKSFKKKIEEFEGRKVFCIDLKDLEKMAKL